MNPLCLQQEENGKWNFDVQMRVQKYNKKNELSHKKLLWNKNSRCQ